MTIEIVLIGVKAEIEITNELEENTEKFYLIIASNNFERLPIAISDAPEIINALDDMFNYYNRQLVVGWNGNGTLPEFLTGLPEVIDLEAPYISLLGISK